MKKLITSLLIIVSLFGYGQTYQNPTFGTVTTKTSPTVTNDPYLTTTGTTGVQGKIAPVNVLIPYTPINYTISGQTIGQQIAAIDAKIGTMGTTSAGLTQRVDFTADNTTVNSVVYFASSLSGKGSTSSGSPPALVLPDNTKAFFTKDIISISQPSPTIGYAGVYSGNLTVSASPTPVATKQRFTVEIYRTDNLGAPLASGVSGAPVGDLGVTVLAILDSGELNLTAGSITNIPVSGRLTQNVTINTGERLRYHVSAAKIGAGGGNVTFGVYYGTSYNSYYDIPVAITTDAVLNKSGVAGVTSTDALNLLNSKIPTNYSKIVYVNATNPNSATIFDLNNPPVTNDDLLKIDVNNLYIGTDASTWVYNGSIYVTKTISSNTSNFYIQGTATDAGNSKTASVIRYGNIGTTGRLIVGDGVPAETNIWVTRDITGGTDSQSILVDGVIKSDVTTAAFLNRTKARTQATSFTLPSLYHYHARQEAFGAGSTVTNQYGYFAEATLIGATNNYGFYGDIPTAANRWNLYMNGTAPNYFNGGVYIGSTSQIGKLLAVTGTGSAINVSSQPSASIVLGNLGTGGNEMPVVSGRTSNNTGLTLMAASAEVNTTPDMRFEIRENDNSDFIDRTTPGFRFTRFGTNLVEILRNGNATFIGNVTVPTINISTTPTTSAGAYDILTRNISTGVVEKIASTSLATSGTYTPTLTNSTNVTGATNVTATYTRVGSMVTVYINVLGTATVASTNTVITGTLPINRVSTVSDLVGSGVAAGSGYTNPHICRFQMTNNTTQFTVNSIVPATGSFNWVGSFSYKVD